MAYVIRKFHPKWKKMAGKDPNDFLFNRSRLVLLNNNIKSHKLMPNVCDYFGENIVEVISSTRLLTCVLIFDPVNGSYSLEIHSLFYYTGTVHNHKTPLSERKHQELKLSWQTNYLLCAYILESTNHFNCHQSFQQP